MKAVSSSADFAAPDSYSDAGTNEAVPLPGEGDPSSDPFSSDGEADRELDGTHRGGEQRRERRHAGPQRPERLDRDKDAEDDGHTYRGGKSGGKKPTWRVQPTRPRDARVFQECQAEG